MQKRTALVLLVVAVVLVVGIFYYYTSQLRGSTFGIYLLKNDELVISDEEIVWYDKNSHEIKLTEEGVKKIQALKVVNVTYGEPFVIKLGNQQIYNGAFWTPISSMSYGGTVIETFVITDNTITLKKGYPTPNFFEGIDPRSDPRILDHFQRLNKLK
ncbi:MAG: hypothetical protein PHD13_07085 [Methanocellales archaeon]|nr:hypothetical protein [Methanocellales archaeon]MDD3291532.1 hypothetical protein [Methanocellales archaeon]MDD5235922.1 hypothetical protein [Methanocellales archaeon]MDD5485314.1 hypothetical protein [Methanocellales archaeon]